MQEHMSAKDWREKYGEAMPSFTLPVIKKVVNEVNKLTEHDIQKQILERLGFLKNGFFWRENSGAVKIENNGKTRFFRAGITGIADIMGVYKGIPIAIEVKRPGKKQSLDQKAFQQRFEICGGLYMICTDSAEIIQQLEAHVLQLRKKRN